MPVGEFLLLSSLYNGETAFRDFALSHSLPNVLGMKHILKVYFINELTLLIKLLEMKPHR